MRRCISEDRIGDEDTQNVDTPYRAPKDTRTAGRGCSIGQIYMTSKCLCNTFKKACESAPTLSNLQRRHVTLSCVVVSQGIHHDPLRLTTVYTPLFTQASSHERSLFVVVVVFITLTDPLRIQPWSQDRRNQTKSYRESEISRESRQKITDKKVASKGHRRDKIENTNKNTQTVETN